MSSFLEEVRRVLMKVSVPSGSSHIDSLSLAVLYKGWERRMCAPWSREGCVQVTFEEVAQQLGVFARGGIGLVLLGFFRSLSVTAHMWFYIRWHMSLLCVHHPSLPDSHSWESCRREGILSATVSGPLIFLRLSEFVFYPTSALSLTASLAPRDTCSTLVAQGNLSMWKWCCFSNTWKKKQRKKNTLHSQKWPLAGYKTSSAHSFSFSFLSSQPTAFTVQGKYEGLERFTQAWIVSHVSILLKPVDSSRRYSNSKCPEGWESHSLLYICVSVFLITFIVKNFFLMLKSLELLIKPIFSFFSLWWWRTAGHHLSSHPLHLNFSK